MIKNNLKDMELNGSISNKTTHINGVPIPKELRERIIYEDMQKRSRTYEQIQMGK